MAGAFWAVEGEPHGGGGAEGAEDPEPGKPGGELVGVPWRRGCSPEECPPALEAYRIW